MIEINNEKDRKIIRKIVSIGLNNSNLLDLLCICLLENRAIILDSNKKSIELITERDKDIDIFAQEVVDFISLIEILKDNGLIFIISNDKMKDKLDNHAGYGSDGKRSVHISSCDPNFEERIKSDPLQFAHGQIDSAYYFIEDYYKSYIVVRSTLRDYVNNDFKTPEQIRFGKQQMITLISVGVAFAIGLASIWISICK